MSIKKTNAMRELDKAKLNYVVISYEVDENNLGAEYVAAKMGQDIRQVFKTLALLSDKKEFIIACIPGNLEIDMKKLAKVAGCKRVEMLELKYLLEYTGYIRGGCSPLGIKKRHTSFIHQTALEHDEIIVSAGQRGLQIKLRPQDLIQYLNMLTGDLTM